MIDILSIIPGKKKHTIGDWYSFNALCCNHRGHSADKRGRGGIKFDSDSWVYSCFNCQFKCGFQLGKQLSRNTKLLLQWCGLDEAEINKISLESLSHRDLLDLKKKQVKAITINFEKRTLPEYAIPVNPNDPDHAIHIDYLRNHRSLSVNDYQFYTVDDEERQRIIIPYYYENQIVGHTSRYYDDRKPKYVSDRQPGYVFNLNNQRSEWTSCILVEGEFDAISIDGCAYMSNTITDEQVHLINRLRKTIIVVPDRDKTGLNICDRALELGYKVSIPDWDSSVKDVNDAVKLYGKLQTLLSIFQCATTSKIKVEMARKKLK